MEGFDEVIVGPELEALDAVVDAVAGGDDDDAIGFIVFAEGFEDLEAVAVGQGNIEEDAVVIERFNPLQGGVFIGDQLAGVCFRLEVAGDALAEGFFVFDDEDLHNSAMKIRKLV